MFADSLVVVVTGIKVSTPFRIRLIPNILLCGAWPGSRSITLCAAAVGSAMTPSSRALTRALSWAHALCAASSSVPSIFKSALSDCVTVRHDPDICHDGFVYFWCAGAVLCCAVLCCAVVHRFGLRDSSCLMKVCCRSTTQPLLISSSS